MGINKALKHVLFSCLTIILMVGVLGFVGTVTAQEVDEIENLQDEIADRESQIEQINKRMSEYREKVNEYSQQTASLINDIALIENQIAIAELDVSSTQVEIEAQQLELEILEEKIFEENDNLARQRGMLKEMIFTLHRRDKVGFIEVLFGASDFNELFDEIEHLESVNQDLNKSLDATRHTKEMLVENQQQQEEALDDLVALQGELKMQQARLEAQQESKNVLISETQQSEAQYRVLMSELRQESQYITSQLAQLQAEFEQKISANDDGSDEYGDSALLTPPVDDYVVTATFHDPTYPFRHLWEHSGYDMAAPTGTPVKAAGPGIVAWAKTGRSYGNYIMVIHSSGYATMYAHLSRFHVSADQYVARGQVIGAVGSTGFSTGPHLHFEVRLNGIPVDPEAYVVGLK